jgi:hypothetical protein
MIREMASNYAIWLFVAAIVLPAFFWWLLSNK